MWKLLLLSLALGAGSVGPGTPLASLQSEKTAQEASDTRHGLKLSIELDRESYAPREAPKLRISLKNESNAPIAVYKEIGWGASSSLMMIVFDITGQGLESDTVFDARHQPPYRQEDFRLINPGQSFSVVPRLSLQLLGVMGPGTYRLVVWYQSPVWQEFAPQGLPVWVRENGSLQSKPVTFKVTP